MLVLVPVSDPHHVPSQRTTTAGLALPVVFEGGVSMIEEQKDGR